MSRKLKISVAPVHKQALLPSEDAVGKSISDVLEKCLGAVGSSRISWGIDEIKWHDGDGKAISISLVFHERDQRSTSRFLFSLSQIRSVEGQKVSCRVVECDGF